MGAAAAALVCLGCIDVSMGQKGAAGDAGAGAAASSDGGADGAASAKGIDCITEPTTGATLCSSISLCPNVYVDHDVYPNCGFRPKGNVLDIECACNGEVCPLGVPTTCAQAQAMLQQQSEGQVCTQVAEGRCTPGTATTGSGTTSTSTCDKTCASECGGNPSCIAGCGC